MKQWKNTEIKKEIEDGWWDFAVCGRFSKLLDEFGAINEYKDSMVYLTLRDHIKTILTHPAMQRELQEQIFDEEA